MKYIKAPFNFVPLNKEVFYPDWANLVSNDIPFSDGEEGVIELKITAKSPIFVRNGHSTNDAEQKNEEYLSFCKDKEGKYFIPGSSVKGMIRSVLEIMSFGKLNIDENIRFTIRDFDNREYDLKEIKNQKEICCGYLYKDEEGKYFIENHGKPYRINHKTLYDYTTTSFFEKNFYTNKNKKEFSNNDERRNAKFKYENYPDRYKDNVFSFDLDEEFKGSNNNRRVKFSEGGEIRGKVVFTGQPDLWTSDDPDQRATNKGKGKFYEFVFPVKDDCERNNFIPVNDLQFEQFKFIYSDSDDWNYWKGELERPRGRVPVFFRGTAEKIKDFGLAFMYKLPFKYTPKELCENIQSQSNADDGLDLADTIFGYTKGRKALKGRVQFGNFKAANSPEPYKKVKAVLSSPKASYYPIYVKQKETTPVPYNGKNRQYSTYNNEKAKIAGWKRYPVHSSGKPKSNLSLPVEGEDENEKISTQFIPLKSGAVFTGKVRVHNLKKVEIGALLSAITFHNNNDKLFHSLGMGKPLGYGKVSVDYKVRNFKYEPRKYMACFEEKMNKVKGDWCESEQIKELFLMANDNIKADVDKVLSYMKMDNDKNKNDFINANKNGEHLLRYSELMCNKLTQCKSIFAEEKMKEEKEKKKNAEKIANQVRDLLKIFTVDIDKDDLEAAENRKNKIDSVVNEGWTYLDGEDDYNKLVDKLKNRKRCHEIFSEYEKLKEQKKWKEAWKLLDNSKIKEICTMEEQEKIEKEISECKKEKAKTLSLAGTIKEDGDIKNNVGRIEGYLSKIKLKSIPDDELDYFFDFIKEKRSGCKKKDKKEWTEISGNRSVWPKIKRVVGEETTKSFYDKLIKNKE